MPNFIIMQDFKKSELRIKYQKRDYSKFNENNFKMDLMDEHLALETENSRNVNYVYKIFNEHLNNTIEKHAPTKYLSKKETELKMNPWLTKGILKSIKIKTKYYKKFMASKGKEHYNIYKLYRDKLNHLIRASKIIYYKNYFTKNKKNSNKVWDGINNILARKKKNTCNKINIIENNKFITDQYEVASKFNIFFTNIGPSLSENIIDLGNNFTQYLPQPNTTSFFLAPTSPDEVASELKSLPESKASDVSIKMIKSCIDQLPTYLSNIYIYLYI